jgi:2-iminobutanoate/2-iminopropanoate deaminase
MGQARVQTTQPGDMMIRFWNPETLPKPGSRYSQLALATGTTQRLEIAGQVGNHADGTLAIGLAAQLDAAFANVDAALAAAAMTRTNLMKVTIYLTENTPEAVTTYRARRDLWIGTATPPAATLLIVAGLANPAWLVEVDAIAAA